MSSTSETTSLVTLLGRVKWFNNKAGYGFITVTDGVKSGSDVFVHHSSIVVSQEQYRYLVQGEYVTLNLVHCPEGAHEYQAGKVSGINGGKLMCETRNELKQSRVAHKQTQSVNDEQQETQQETQASTPTLQRGSGPRDKAAASVPQVKRGRGRPAKAAISTNL
jgi:CspA family cold shock protein